MKKIYLFCILGLIQMMPISISFGQKKITVMQDIQYFLKNHPQEILFRQFRERAGDDKNFTQTSELFDVSEMKNPVMKEFLKVASGEIFEHRVEQLQTNEAWDLRVEGNQLHYQNFKIIQGQKVKDGKETIIEKPKNFTNGPMIDLFVNQHWSELESGQEIPLEFSVLEVSKPMSFTLRKVGEGSRKGKKTLILEMRAVSVVIRFLLDPIKMEFLTETKQLVHFSGRTPVKIKEGSKFKPFDAEIEYSAWK